MIETERNQVEDHRSVDELLNFINGGDTKQNKGKKRKKKKKKKTTTTTNNPTNASNNTTTNNNPNEKKNVNFNQQNKNSKDEDNKKVKKNNNNNNLNKISDLNILTKNNKQIPQSDFPLFWEEEDDDLKTIDPKLIEEQDKEIEEFRRRLESASSSHSAQQKSSVLESNKSGFSQLAEFCRKGIETKNKNSKKVSVDN